MPRRPRGQQGLTETQEADYKTSLKQFAYWTNVYNLCLVMNATLLDLLANGDAVVDSSDASYCQRLFEQILSRSNENLLRDGFLPIVASSQRGTNAYAKFANFINAANRTSAVSLYNFEDDNVTFLNLEANYRTDTAPQVIPTLIRSKMREAAYFAIQKVEQIQPVGLRATLAAQVMCLPPTYGALLTNSTPASLSITQNPENSYISREGLLFFAENDWLYDMFLTRNIMTGGDTTDLKLWLQSHTGFVASGAMIENYIRFLRNTKFSRAYAYRLLFFMIQDARNIPADALPQYRVSSLDSPYLPLVGFTRTKKSHVYDDNEYRAEEFKAILYSYGTFRNNYYGLPYSGNFYRTTLTRDDRDATGVSGAIALMRRLDLQFNRLGYIDAFDAVALYNALFEEDESEGVSAMELETVDEEPLIEERMVQARVDSADILTGPPIREYSAIATYYDNAFTLAQDAGTAKISDFFLDADNTPYSPYYFAKEVFLIDRQNGLETELYEDLKARHDLIPCGTVDNQQQYAEEFESNPNFKNARYEIPSEPGTFSEWYTPDFFATLRKRERTEDDSLGSAIRLNISEISGGNNIVNSYGDVERVVDFLFDWSDFAFYNTDAIRAEISAAKRGTTIETSKIGIPDFGTPIFMRPFFAKRNRSLQYQNLSSIRQATMGDLSYFRDIYRINERNRLNSFTDLEASSRVYPQQSLIAVDDLEEFVENPFMGYLTTAGTGIAQVDLRGAEDSRKNYLYVKNANIKDYMHVLQGSASGRYAEYTQYAVVSNTVKKNWIYALLKVSLASPVRPDFENDVLINQYLQSAGSSLYYWLRACKLAISEMGETDRKKIAGYMYNVLDLGTYARDNTSQLLHYQRMIGALYDLTGVKVVNDFENQSLSRTARSANNFPLDGYTKGGTYFLCYTLLLCFYAGSEIPDEVFVNDAIKNTDAKQPSKARQIEVGQYFHQFIHNLKFCASISKLKQNPSAYRQGQEERILLNGEISYFMTDVLLKRYTSKDFFGVGKVEDYVFENGNRKSVLLVDSFMQDLKLFNLQADTQAGLYVWHQTLHLIKDLGIRSLTAPVNNVPLADWVIERIKKIPFNFGKTISINTFNPDLQHNLMLDDIKNLTDVIQYVGGVQILNIRVEADIEGIFALDRANLLLQIYPDTQGTYQRKYLATAEYKYTPYFAGVIENAQGFVDDASTSITAAPQLAEIYERIAEEPLMTSVGTEYEAVHPTLDGVSGATRAFREAGWEVLGSGTARSMNAVKIVYDPSVFNWKEGTTGGGIEVVPGPQIGDAIIEYNALIIKQLLALGFQTHYSAGLHIHLQTKSDNSTEEGPNVLTIEQKKNLLYNVGAMEPFFLECTIPEFRRESAQYWGKSIFRRIKNNMNQFERLSTNPEIQGFFGGDRYHFVNVMSESEQPTYEFRFPTSNFDINYVEHMIRTLSKIYEFSKVARVPARGKIDYEKFFGTAIYTYWMNNALTYARISDLGDRPKYNVNLPWRFDPAQMRNEY